MTVTKHLHWFILAILALAFSCAKQVSPTGGPKDTIPPVLVKASPPNESIRFRGNEIELQFSEDVNLNSPKEQLIITPRVKEYKITYRRNTVKIQFEEPLKDSTTYTLNFRDAVQDLTERNPVRNLSLAYSTGNYIDSLSVEGTVFDLLKGKPVKDATVALHVRNDTFNILLHPAVYFTKTDDKGRFKISHLQPNAYFIYAFEDKNRNLIVNSRTESYGFRAEHIDLRSNVKDIDIGIIRLDAGPLRITSARPYNTYYNIRTSKNLRTFTIASADSLKLAYTFGENQANIRIYDTFDADSAAVHLIAHDSLGNAIDTTLYAKFLTRDVTPERFQMQVPSTSLLAQTGQFKATFQLSKPLQTILYDSIYLQIDSLTKIQFAPEDFAWDPIPRKLELRKQLDPRLFNKDEPNGSSSRASRFQRLSQQGQQTAATPTAPQQPQLYLGKAAFITVEADSSAQTSQSVKPLRPDELSEINLAIRTNQPSFIVQLLDNNYNIVAQIRDNPKPVFRDVIPGDYQIRLVIDFNKNGKWDPGNYFQMLEPEPIVYYRAPDGSTNIKGVKANWVIGTDGAMFITY